MRGFPNTLSEEDNHYISQK